MLESARTAGKHRPTLEMPEDARNNTQLPETARNWSKIKLEAFEYDLRTGGHYLKCPAQEGYICRTGGSYMAIFRMGRFLDHLTVITNHQLWEYPSTSSPKVQIGTVQLSKRVW